MKNILSVFFLVMLFLSETATALDIEQMTVKQYLLLKKSNPQAVEAYFAGLYSAFFIANAQLESNKQPLLFCVENGFTPTGKGLQNSFDAMVGKDLGIKGEDTVNVASLALWVERQAFPCK